MDINEVPVPTRQHQQESLTRLIEIMDINENEVLTCQHQQKQSVLDRLIDNELDPSVIYEPTKEELIEEYNRLKKQAAEEKYKYELNKVIFTADVEEIQQEIALAESFPKKVDECFPGVIHQSLVEEFSCSLCNEIYIEPRMVHPCCHTFCAYCLEKYLHFVGENECPKCNANGVTFSGAVGIEGILESAFNTVLIKMKAARQESVMKREIEIISAPHLAAVREKMLQAAPQDYYTPPQEEGNSVMFIGEVVNAAGTPPPVLQPMVTRTRGRARGTIRRPLRRVGFNNGRGGSANTVNGNNNTAPELLPAVEIPTPGGGGISAGTSIGHGTNVGRGGISWNV